MAYATGVATSKADIYRGQEAIGVLPRWKHKKPVDAECGNIEEIVEAVSFSDNRISVDSAR